MKSVIYKLNTRATIESAIRKKIGIKAIDKTWVGVCGNASGTIFYRILRYIYFNDLKKQR
jgi:hypothetical protein